MPLTAADIQTLLGAGSDATQNDLTALLGTGGYKGGGLQNTLNYSALSGNKMGPNWWMAGAGAAGAAIPFVQGLRLGREVKRFKPTNLVPQQAYDVVQNLRQQLNAPATNYGQRMQDLNDARAARMAYAKKAGTASDFLKTLYASEDMYNKGMRQLGAEGSQEQVGRRAAYNAALANLGAQEAASAQKNREALAALKQARDINYAKSGEGLINSLINSVVLKPKKETLGGDSSTDYTQFFEDFMKGQEGGSASNATPYQMSGAYKKPSLYTPFQFDPALTQKNSLYPFIKP